MRRSRITPALVLCLTAAGEASADCYEAGNHALDAGRVAEAAAAFGHAAGRPECAPSRAGLLYNKADALKRLAQTDADPVRACDAALAYREALAAQPRPSVADASRAALPAVEKQCASREQPPPKPPPPPPPVPPAPDHTLEWSLTAGAATALGASGVLFALALDSADERDAADQRWVDADRGSAAESAALDDFYAARSRTDALGISSYVLGGVGVVLAIGATIAWLGDDEPPATVLMLRPDGMGIAGVW